MTSPRRSKKSGAQCAVQVLDWDSPSAETGTVKRRRSSCPENTGKHSVPIHDAIFEVQTPSDSGSGTSRSIDDNDKSDPLTEVEERISCIINENRSSQSNSESSDVDIIIDTILSNPSENLFETVQNEPLLCDRGKTFIKQETISINAKQSNVPDAVPHDKKVKARLKTPAPIKKLNKTFEISKNSSKLVKEPARSQDKASVLPVYKSTVQGGSIDLNSSQKKKPTTKLRLPFSPARTMDKPKINFFHNKPNLQESKPSPLLSSPVRRTISNEYVRLKFTNDTVIRRTIDGKSVPKITPKIQSIIPESPVDSEDPFLNLSPNKKYTVTVNNKVRCDKDNYVIFDPNTGFTPEALRSSRIPLKSPTGEKSRIALKSPGGENSGLVRKSANVSDTDSGILSPNSPVETSEQGSAYYVNAAAFSETAKKCGSEIDITILDPGLAKKAAEQIQTSPKKSKAETSDVVTGARATQGAGAAGGGLISYAPGWSLKGEHLMKWQESGKTTIEIYTDWANHYLERARSRRRAGASGGGLARDCADGLLLADVLEGVTGLKVPRAHRKPRNPQQMLENVQCCLDFLHAQKVQGLEQVTAVDIRDAKLKAVLALFFALSRHKQAAKQRTTPSSGNAANAGKNLSEDVSLSAVQRITGGSSCDEILTACANNVEMTTLTANRQVSVLQTSIPLPASAAAARRAPPDKRPLPATPHAGGKSGLSASSSRSTSPLGQGAVSFIPRAPTSSSGSRPNSSLLAPGSKIPSTLAQQHPQTPSSQNGTPTKHSMLDKLKLFNKDKLSNEKQNSKSTAVSKRTSSSSGFSSAKSERSDSSLSLNESSNTPNAHIKSSNLVGPKTLRQQSDTLSKDKSGKNVKPKLVSSKSPKECSTSISKSSGRTSSEKSRNSPKLPARDKESKLAAPKSISNTKLNQIDDHSRNSNAKLESKMVKLSGSQMKLSEKRSDSTTDVKNQENVSPSSKGHASQQQAAAAQNFGTPNHTGIPKPTAAVKGTFKIAKDDRHIIHKSTNSQLSPIQSNSSLNSTNNISSLPFTREQSNLSKDISQKQTLAVSPMPVVSSGVHNHTSQMSESSHSNSTHSTTGQHSNSSDSSVIYRPSSESGSEISKTATNSMTPNKRLDMNTTYINEVINEAEISEKQAAQRRIMDKSPKPNFDHNRTLTELNKSSDSRSSTPSHCRDNSLGDDENPLMNVLPMRPLLRGYNSHLTLPMRTSGLTQKNIPGYPHHANTVKANFGRENMGLRDRINYGPGFSNPDYCDLDIASGYMSDGDCLRRINLGEMECGRNNDMMDGYMSEGGASLYGRRMNYQQPSQLQQLDERRGGRRGMEGGSGVVYRVVGRTRSKADCGQQTERQPPAPRQDTTWKKYTDSPGVGAPPLNQPAPAPPSPSHGRKGERRAGHHSPQHHKREKLTAAQQLGIAPHPQYAASNSSGQHSSRSGGSQLQSPGGGSSRPSSVSSGGNGSSCSSGKAKVPQSFGYVKRQNGVQQPAPQSNGPPQHGGRTAQVSAVPRTKVKVSGGTQTCTQDLQIHKNGIGPKSYSLGGTAAAQLSASVRERLLGSQSLPKPGTHEFAALFHHHRIAPRGGIKISDGSLSDTQTYSEVKSDYGIPYAPWLRHSNTYSASGRLSEGESMESLTSLHSAQAQAHSHTSPNSHHRSSLTHNKLIMHRDAQGSRLNRSNSIRSTKSEKLYPSMLQRSSESDYEPYYCLPVQYGPGGQGLNYGVSEPPSPSPRSALSPTHQPGNVMHTPRHSHHYPKKNDDVHGSTASLVSTASSLAAGAGSEERQAHEVRKLRRELADAKEKVHTLTTQLTTNKIFTNSENVFSGDMKNIPDMAVTTSPTYHGSPIHDGFATIRAPRSRIKIRNLVEPNQSINLPQRHSEYFTLNRTPKNSFLDSSCGVQYVNNDSAGTTFVDKPSRLSFTEPIYAKITPPPSKCNSPVKIRNGKQEIHYDSIDTKPRRRLKSLELPSEQDVSIGEKIGISNLSNGERQSYEQHVAIQDGGELHSVRTDFTGSSIDCRRSHSDRDNCSETSSYFTDNDRPISSYSDNSTIPSTDTEDVLKDLPNKSKFHRSPQKYATLNSRRPKFIDLKLNNMKENPLYGSLQRNRIGYHSEPNTPLNDEHADLHGEPTILSEVQQIPRMPLQNNRNGFKRSVSETNGFSKRLNYRHSFSADFRPQRRPHKCCECVTGIPADEDSEQISTRPLSRTLGTLYESQDSKIGCQTILRAKPPVPWWELAIKKSRYKSCPILEEAHVVSAFEQSLSNMTQRLQQLTATAERKDSELTELRQTIELLRKQSIQAGLTTAHMQSMGIRADGVNVTGQDPPNAQSQSSPQRGQTGNGAITRHLSTDSVSSINSLSSGSSAPHDKKHKKKGWLRSSFTKAFSRNAKISKTAKHSSLGQLSSQDSSSGSHHYDDPHTIREGSNENSLEHSHETLDVKDKCPAANTEEQTKDKPDDSGLVDELKRQLREKDLVLTDIRLEALSSAHQLESLKDTVIKMRNEMLNLKQNNERLQRLVTSRSLAGSQSSLGTGGSAVEDPRRFSLADQATMHQATIDIHSQPLDLDFNCMTSTPTMDFSKKGSPKSSIEPIYGNKAACELNENSETLLGALNGSSDLFANGLNASERLSGDYDINSVLPPPKTRELAIGESYSDIGVADSQGDTTDGKKIAIAVYLGQPETFQRYFEEVQDTLTESECRFYAKQSASSYNNHFEKQSSFDSPRMPQNRSPETETQDYSQINKSNTNSLKSNKSTHSTSYKNVYNSDSTINCNEFTIAYTYISGKTTWQNLDYIVRKTFKDYLSRIDLGTNLGLNTDSITSYHLGEATRGPEIGFPELLPCGYIIGTVNTLYICLEGVGSLAFDSLIPKNIVYRYVSLLSEHRRIILCGPSGTGKSYLAAKLAEFYVQKTQRRGNPAEAVATFNVDRKSCNELRAYLANIAEQCGAAAAPGEEAALPSVVILDNLQHASALGDAFAGLLPPDNRNMPVIIGTMSQATCNTTNLQLHHNFRWLLTANHMEPVKGFLARYLRRKLFTLELRLGRREPALAAVLEWLPAVWSTLNAFLEAHSSSDVTVGPRLFLACPMDLEASQAWFADVWNYSIVPYASEAVREGIALYGRRRHAAVDPLQHIKSTYPWREPNHSHTLRAITVEEIGIEEGSQDPNTNNNQDPLLNMLMRLQEAANYSGNQSQDSDNASMDSNLTHDSSMGNEL